MGVDLLLLWFISGKVRSPGRRTALLIAWMAAAALLGAGLIAWSFRVAAQPWATNPGAVAGLRVGGVAALLEVYFLTSFLWLPKLFDRMEATVAEVTVAVRQLRARKSGFLTVISFLAFFGVGLGAFALCLTISVMGGFGNDLKRKILGNNAHVIVDRERGGFQDWEPLLAAIRRVPEVTSATPFVHGEVMITSATNLSGVILRGVDPASTGVVRTLRHDLIRGRVEYLEHPERIGDASPFERRPVSARGEEEPPPPPGATVTRISGATGDIDRRYGNDPAAPEPPLPGIIVGRELANNLHLVVGEQVTVVSPFGSIGPLGPMPKTKAFRIAGIFYSGMYEYDTKYAYVLIPVAQRFFNHQNNAITSIEIRVADVDRSDAVTARVAELARSRHLRVRDWKDLNQNLFRALKLEKLMIFLLLTVAIIVASFSIVATLLLLVTEKGREIAVLKAMGASDGFIMRVFIAVGALIGVVGALLGTTGALVTCLVAQRVGIPLDPEVYYIERLPVTIAPADYALVFVTSVAICLLAATFPAWLAGRLRPVEGLRFG
ncbi:MAG: ABC transporter permease [Polyangiales bacterium]